MTPEDKKFLIHALRSSIQHKKTAKWSHNVSAGFISDDIEEVDLASKSKQDGTFITIVMHGRGS